MQTLTTDIWQFRADNVPHKQAMFDFATYCGVPVAHPLLGHRDDEDIYISWFGGAVGLGTLPTRVGDYRVMRNRMVDETEFMAMCRAYQAEQDAVATLTLITT